MSFVGFAGDKRKKVEISDERGTSPRDDVLRESVLHKVDLTSERFQILVDRKGQKCVDFFENPVQEASESSTSSDERDLASQRQTQVHRKLAKGVDDDVLEGEFIPIGEKVVEDMGTNTALDIKETSLLTLLARADQVRRTPDPPVLIVRPLAGRFLLQGGIERDGFVEATSSDKAHFGDDVLDHPTTEGW